MTRTAHAQSLPDIRYAVSSNTIYVGRAYDVSNPAEADYVGYPSHPNAPKSVITLAQLADRLSVFNVLTRTNGSNSTWFLSANIIVSQTARLEIASPEVTELRLMSVAQYVGGQLLSKQYIRFVINGGTVVIKGVSGGAKIQVKSWNTAANTVDTSFELGRSYITALNGARLEILDAEVSYLGWKEANPRFENGIGQGEPSGLSWKRRATATRPETGPTGSVINSLIHHGYYGVYTWQAINMTFSGNQIYNNAYYGLDPHDYSANFVINNNEFYKNGAQGLILSRGCIHNKIYQNKSYQNKLHGMMLDRGSDFNEMYENESYDNGEDGIALFESSNNIIRDNYVYNNARHGIRVNAVYDPGDPFDAVANNNFFKNNIVSGNLRYGVNLYERADQNRFEGNTILGNGEYGVYIATGGNILQSNIITDNQRDGLVIVGGLPPAYQQGLMPIVPATSQPGYGNLVTANVIEANVGNGIFIKRASNNWIAQNNKIRNNGLEGINLSTNTLETQIIANAITGNERNGVYLSNTTTKRNRISANTITNNTLLGINITNANNKLKSPKINGVSSGVVTGTLAPANGRVEIYRDPSGEGAVYKGFTLANNRGDWSFPLPAGDSAAQGTLTALAIDGNGNTSLLSTASITKVVATAAEHPEDEAEEEDLTHSDAYLLSIAEQNRAAAQEDMKIPDEDAMSRSLQGLELPADAILINPTEAYIPYKPVPEEIYQSLDAFIVDDAKVPGLPSSSIVSRVYLPMIVSPTQNPTAGFLFEVTKEKDTNDGLCDIDCSLREAAVKAAQLPGIDTIYVPAGSYSLTLGVITLSDHLLGVDPRTVIIDGNKGRYTFVITKTEGSITLQGVTLQGAKTALSVEGNTQQVTLERSVIANNGFSNFNAPCGGIENEGSRLTIHNTIFWFNRGAQAGAICAGNGATELRSVLVKENSADPLGTGVGGIGNANPLWMQGAMFEENSGRYGGAIATTGETTILQSSIVNNKADYGGGIYASYPLTNSENPIRVNQIVDGQIDSGIAAGHAMTISNSTISGNTALADGGGIYYTADGSTLGLQMDYLTLFNNSADVNTDGIGRGGGLAYGASPSMASIGSSIMAFNTTGNGQAASNCATISAVTEGGELTSRGYNLVSNLIGCSMNGDTTHDVAHPDPDVEALAQNGEPRLSHLPSIVSKVIDAANPATCPATDQRSLNRPQGDGCDIGAIELGN